MSLAESSKNFNELIRLAFRNGKGLYFVFMQLLITWISLMVVLGLKLETK